MSSTRKFRWLPAFGRTAAVVFALGFLVLFVRRSAQEAHNTVLSSSKNLRQLSSGAEQYYVESDATPTAAPQSSATRGLRAGVKSLNDATNGGTAAGKAVANSTPVNGLSLNLTSSMAELAMSPRPNLEMPVSVDALNPMSVRVVGRRPVVLSSSKTANGPVVDILDVLEYFPLLPRIETHRALTAPNTATLSLSVPGMNLGLPPSKPSAIYIDYPVGPSAPPRAP